MPGPIVTPDPYLPSPSESGEIPAASSIRKRAEWQFVVSALEAFCADSDPGTVLPSHAEWMHRLDASERAVRAAVEEMRRQGRVVTRRGARTCIAERPAAAPRPRAPFAWETRNLVETIAHPDHGFYDHAIELLFGLAGEQGLSLVCHSLEPGTGTLAPIFDGLARRCIFLGRQFLPLARSWQAAGHRVVLLGTPNLNERPGVPNVCFDHERGGYLATRHLLDLGHNRLAFLGEATDLATPRWQGHAKALDAAARRGRAVAVTRFNRAQVADWMTHPDRAAEYFRAPGAPTGIVAWNDQEALPLLGLLAHAGLRVPQDVSVVGHDNLPASALVFPRLTTVEISMEEQLEAALDVLGGPSDPSPELTTMVLPTLVPRESSGPPGGESQGH